MMKIYCPKCKRKPDMRSVWRCFCGHEFDPFENISKCPSCGYSHEFTECQHENCRAITPHLSWYEGLQIRVNRLILEVKVASKDQSQALRKS